MLENSGFEKYSSNGLPTGCTDEDEEKTYSIGYNYSSDSKYLKSINHNGTNYNIEYDQYGNKTDSKVGTQSLAKYTYNANNGACDTLTYGTGQKNSYSYDFFGNTKSIKYNGNTAFNFYTWRTLTHLSFGNLANNLGYIMQRYNLLTEYNWTVSFTYHY